MLLFDSVYFRFGSEESLPGLSQLRETVVDHRLISVSIHIPQVLVLLHLLLRHSVVEEGLLRSQISKVVVLANMH